MKSKFLMSAVLVITLTLAACAPKAAAPTKKAGAATTAVPAAKATAIPTQMPKSSPTSKPQPTPTKAAVQTATPETAAKAPVTPTVGPALINDILVNNQAVKDGAVLIGEVDALKSGWVAIFTDQNDQPGTLLGYVAVPEGTSSDVKVTIDTAKASDKMIAMLLVDAGKMGTFEYPGADTPAKNANVSTNVMAIFSKTSASSQ